MTRWEPEQHDTIWSNEWYPLYRLLRPWAVHSSYLGSVLDCQLWADLVASRIDDLPSGVGLEGSDG